MSDSTTRLDQISQSQAQKEASANAVADAMSNAALFGRRASTTGGLTWGYYGGVAPIEGEPVAVDNGTILLTGSATNYVYAEPSAVSPVGWTVIKTTSIPAGWPGPLAADRVALYEIVCASTTVSSYLDWRASGTSSGGGGGAVAGSDTQVQFNDGGDFGGDSGLTFDKTSNALAVGGDLTVGGDLAVTDSLSADEVTATNGVSVGSGAVNAQTGTSYTLLASDNGKLVTLSNASAITLTVPASLGAGFSCMIAQLGAGTVTVTPSSTTVNSKGALLALDGQYAAATLFAYAANVFLLAGALA